MKEKICHLISSPGRVLDEMTTAAADLEKATYVLPDGSHVDISSGPRTKAPEILFRPDLYGSEYEGIHEVLAYSIQKSDLDLRKIFYSNIVLSGGSTLFKGFGDRLLGELRRVAPKDAKIRISAPQERIYSTFIGGSILASLDTFKRMWVTRKEFDEEGARAIHRKTF